MSSVTAARASTVPATPRTTSVSGSQTPAAPTTPTTPVDTFEGTTAARDPASGLPTGKRQHKPLTLRTE